MSNVVDMSKNYRGQDQVYKFDEIMISAATNAGKETTVDTTTVFVTNLDMNEDVTSCYGAAIPADGESGYSNICLFHHTSAEVGESVLYQNLGDNSSCQFEAIGSGGGGGDVRPTVPQDYFTVKHAADAATKNRLYMAYDTINIETKLVAATDGDLVGARVHESQNGKKIIYFREYGLNARTVNIQHNPDPMMAGASTVHWKATGGEYPQIGMFVTNSPSFFGIAFEHSNGVKFKVHHDANATDHPQVYYDESSEKLRANTIDLDNVYVQNDAAGFNQYIQIEGHGNPSAVGDVELYVDTASADVTNVFMANLASGVTETFNLYNVANGDPKGAVVLLPVYFDKNAPAGQQLKHNLSILGDTDKHQEGYGFMENIFVTIVFDADAATNGTAVYVDHTQAVTERLLTVDDGAQDQQLAIFPDLRPSEVIKPS